MKAILFELTNDDESENSIGGEEVLIIKEWENSTLYFNCRRIDGVIEDIGYCRTVNQPSNAEFHNSLAEHYTCRGFVSDEYLMDMGGVETNDNEELQMLIKYQQKILDLQDENKLLRENRHGN